MLKKAIGLFSAVLLVISVITAAPVSAVNQTPAGYVVMSVERFTIGEGYFLHPQKVPFYEGDSYASVVVRQLGEENLKFTGTVDDGFYLLGIKNADNGEIDPPEYLVDYLIENSIDFSENTDSDLDSGDYTYMSGWMFYVNNTEPYTGMPDTVPQDGDVFRLMYTLTWGQDLGNSSWNNIAELPDKDSLNSMISLITAREDYNSLAALPITDSQLNQVFADVFPDGTTLGGWIEYLPKLMSQSPSQGLATSENFGLIRRVITSMIPKNSGDRVDFPQFHGETGSVGVIDAKTPMTAQKTVEKYAKKFGSSWNDTPGTPIVVGDSLYCLIAGQKKLYRVNKDTGNVIAVADCDGTSQFFSLIAYGEDKIFVPRSAKIDGKNVTVVYAYDAETLNQLWISEPIGKPEDKVTPLGSIIYSNGYVYLGVSNSSGSKGAFACIAAADEDTETSDEIKKAAWQYMPEDGMRSGYYWCGGAVAKNAIIFGGEATELVSHSLTDETVYDRLVLEDNSSSGIRSTVYYDEATRRVFATTKSGYIYSVKLNADNTFDAASLMKTNLGSANTSSPVVFGGRVYVGGGGLSAKYGFSVLNAEDLSVIYQISDFKSQSSPVLTTAYANEENGMTVVLYLIDYQTSKLYAVYDSAGQTEQNFECIATPSATQYCTQSIAADGEGNIYYYNDGGAIFCFGQKNESDAIYTATDVKNQIALYASQPITAGMLTVLQRIKTRMEALDTLSDVTNAETLYKMIDDATALSDQLATVKRLNEELANLDAEAITLADDNAVTNWLAAYYGLTEENRAGVVRSAELLAAANKLKELKDAAVISELHEKIAALPSEEKLTLKGEAEVKSVIQLLSSQNEEVRGAVNSAKLDRLALKLSELHSAVDALDSAIETQLDPVLITEKHRKAVEKLISAYNALSEDDRAFVKNADTLLYAQRVLAGLDRGVIIAEVFEKLYGTDLVYIYYGDGFTLKFNGADVTDITSDYVIDQNNIPGTGDTSNPLIFIAIAAVCAVILAGSIIILKKGKR